MKKLKILQVIPSLNRGGAERLVLDICQELLTRSEVEVRLVVFSSINDYREYKDVKTTIVDPKVELSMWKPNKINVSSLQKIIDEFEPNVIHTHLFLAELYTRFCNSPSATWFSHVHDNMHQLENFSVSTILSRKKLANWYEKGLLMKQYRRKKNKFIAISADCNEYINKAVPFCTSILIHNAVNLQRFNVEKNSFMRDGVLRLLMVGSLVEKKNQQLAICVCQELNLMGIETELSLAGDGPLMGELVANAEELKLKDKVHFLGVQQEIEYVFGRSDIYIHTAKYEPFGLVLLEAMAAKLPVVTIDGKGNRDVVRDKMNGLLFDHPTSAKEIAAAIQDLVSDTSKRDRMIQNAAEFVSAYGIKTYVNKLLQAYCSSCLE